WAEATAHLLSLGARDGVAAIVTNAAQPRVEHWRLAFSAGFKGRATIIAETALAPRDEIADGAGVEPAGRDELWDIPFPWVASGGQDNELSVEVKGAKLLKIESGGAQEIAPSVSRKTSPGARVFRSMASGQAPQLTVATRPLGAGPTQELCSAAEL